MLHAAACVKRACMLRAAAVRHVARAYSVGRFVAPPTVRTGLRDDIRRSLAALHGDYYIVVHGPRCVGKSRLIDAALAGERGVWSVDVMPGTKAAEIIKCATEHLGVASLLQLVGFRPIVVLRVVERTYYNAPAGVAAAVKVLTSKHGLRVIVDAEEYSIDDNVLETTRQCVFWVGEMSRDELMQIPDVQDAMQELTRNGLDQAAWQIFGGVPTHYMQADLLATMQRELRTALDRIHKFRCKKNVVDDEADMLIKKLTGGPVHRHQLGWWQTNYQRYGVYRKEGDYVVPVNAATRFALQRGLYNRECFRVPQTAQDMIDLVGHHEPQQ